MAAEARSAGVSLTRPSGGSAPVSFALLGVLALAIVPLPPAALDLLLALSLAVSVLTFMVAVHVERPLEFSAFPSLLLLVTLFRLALSIATTRQILLHGAEGPEAAGGVIHAFGAFAVGGNFVVGAVVFLILVIVNFIVITKGAERISEVAARFTLDSLPGKQMAIDADLGAGLIDETGAKARRAALEQEADFHGSMDGASKFVRGDAIAGLLIVGINLVGGLLVGVLQHGLSVAKAVETFAILTIGDGLVTQIPALLVSTGAALLTTRGAVAGDLGTSLGDQLFSRRRPLFIAAAALAALSLLPGMPHAALFGLAGATAILSRRARRDEPRSAEIGSGAAAPPTAGAGDVITQKAEIEALLPLELISLEVGLDVLPLVDAAKGGEVLGRIAALRKQIALDLGVVIPPIHVKDDLRQRPGGYRILLSGARVAHGEIRSGRLLAIDPTGQALGSLGGERVDEPTFGLPAKWIAPSERARADGLGLTVVDPASVIATHLSEVLRRNAHELLGRREAQELLDLLAKQNSKVVEELVPHLMSLGDVIKVLKALLREGVSVRDLRSILEALADHAAVTKDPLELVELVRQRLGRQISRSLADASGRIPAYVLDPRVEELFRAGGRGADPQALSRATHAIEEAARRAVVEDTDPVLVVAADVRRALGAVAQRHAPGLRVISYRELDPDVPLANRGVVTMKEING